MRSPIILRDATSADSPEVVRLWRENHSHDFDLPDPRRSFANTTVLKDGKVVGYGMLVIHPEAVMLLDRSLPRRDKVEVLQRLMKAAISNGREMQFQHLYAFTSSPSFADVLRKHFGAENMRDEGLIIDFGGK